MPKITDRVLTAAKQRPKRYEIRDSELSGFCVVVRPTGSKSFLLRYRNITGKARSYTLGKWGTLTVTQARRMARQLLAEVRLDVDIQTRRTEARAISARRVQQTVERFFYDVYQAYCCSHMKSGKHRASVIESYFVPWLGSRPMESITPLEIIRWRDQRMMRGLKPGGVNRPISALKAMLNRAVEWGVIDSNPLTVVKPIPEAKSPIVRYLTEDEEARLFAALDRRQAAMRNKRRTYNVWCIQRGRQPFPWLDNLPYTDHLKPIVTLAMHTGLRRNELFVLRWEHVDIERRLLRIDGLTSKTQQTRFVALNDIALRTVQDWKASCLIEGDYVFTSARTGGVLDNIDSSWKGVVRDAEIEKFRFHDLRHTFASRLVMAGVGLYTVGKLLGHQSLETTQRYAHLSPHHEAAAVAKLVR